jgi:hypothetical protein
LTIDGVRAECYNPTQDPHQKRGHSMLRRVALVALALAATAGFSATGSASAATLGHIKNGSTFTVEHSNSACVVVVFSSNGTWSADAFNDAGTWFAPSVSTVDMKWTAGLDNGLKFKGTWTTTPVKEYVGTFSGIGSGAALLVKGAVAGCF